MGVPWGSLRVPVGSSGGPLGRCGVPFGAPGVLWGSFEGPYGVVWGTLGALWGPILEPLATLGAPLWTMGQKKPKKTPVIHPCWTLFETFSPCFLGIRIWTGFCRVLSGQRVGTNAQRREHATRVTKRNRAAARTGTLFLHL